MYNEKEDEFDEKDTQENVEVVDFSQTVNLVD